jgi:hypothetical protein
MRSIILALFVLCSCGCNAHPERGDHVRHRQSHKTGIVTGNWSGHDVSVSWDDDATWSYVDSILLEVDQPKAKPEKE